MGKKKLISETTLAKEICSQLSTEDYESFLIKTVVSDEALKKIYQFTFPLFTFEYQLNPSIFPLEQKKKQFRQISDYDREYFFNRFDKTPQGPDKQSFRLLKYGFEAMYAGIRFIIEFPDTEIPLHAIFYQTGRHLKKTFIDDNENKEIQIEVGKYFPYLWLTYTHDFNSNMVKCSIDWQLRHPDNNELRLEEAEWSKYSFKQYQLLADEYLEILAGYDIRLGKDTNTTFRIYYLYRGKELKLSKRGFFEFPIVHRYKPKIISTAKRLRKLDDLSCYGTKNVGNKLFMDGFLWEATKEVLDLAKKYEDKPEYPNPEGYLQSKLQHFLRDPYKKLFTESKKVFASKDKPKLRAKVEREAGSLDEVIGEEKYKLERDVKEISKGNSTEDKTFEGENTFSENFFIMETTFKKILELLTPKLNPIELTVFNFLRENISDDNKITQKEIGAKIGKDRSTVSRIQKQIKLKAKDLCEELGIPSPFE